MVEQTGVADSQISRDYEIEQVRSQIAEYLKKTFSEKLVTGDANTKWDIPVVKKLIAGNNTLYRKLTAAYPLEE
jgi:hypothetical protein